MKSLQHSVNLDDLDFMGIISHYKWVELFERFRTILWNEQFATLQSMGLGLVVFQVEVSYKKPAKFRDEVIFHCKVTDYKESRFIALQEAKNAAGDIYASAKIHFCCINSKLKPNPIPDVLKQGM